MIKLQTYRLEPFIAANGKTESLSTQWLRKSVNKLMRDKHESLEKEGADVSLFYNHDPKTEHTRIGYPLIIYHYINGVFYIVGINEGATALALLAKHYKSPFSMDEVVFQGFRKENSGGELEPGIISELRSYALVEWRPIHHDHLNAFIQMDMTAKVKELNNRLEKHIVNELGKYLGISFEKLNCVITNITGIYEQAIYKKRYKYPAYDIEFKANISLPELLTLGNHQALGYGRIVPL